MVSEIFLNFAELISKKDNIGGNVKIKLFILALLLIITTIVLAEKHGLESSFNEYIEDPTFENFAQAMNYYANPDEQDFSGNLMLSYLYSMEMERNLEILAVNIDSLNAKTRFSYANLLLGLNRFDESIQIYNSLNEEYPNWSCPWRHKGEAYYKLEKLAEAETAVLKAIETREDHFDAYVMLAEIRRDAGNPAQALETLEQGLEYFAKDTENEVETIDVKFLHLELLKLNHQTEKYQILKKELLELAPNDERLGM